MDASLRLRGPIRQRCRAEGDAMNITNLLARKGPKVITIRPDQTIRQALALRAAHNIGALIVVDDVGAPIGILSERDIVREAARNETVFSKVVSSLMTTNLIVGAPGDDLVSVGTTMTDRRIRHLPIVHQSRLVGIVSIGDIVKAHRMELQGEVDTLQTQLLAQ
jgi:CBS domain-containing protein